jgi:hypothetical protein
MGSGYRWLFNGAIPLFTGGAFDVNLEYGIPAFSLLRIMPDPGNMPQADLVALGARANWEPLPPVRHQPEPRVEGHPFGGLPVLP